jgi:hypothetical protein
MIWVKFHEELTNGAKHGIPREWRFVLMELSLLCRPKRGWVELPLGMSDVDGVCELLGGNRRQVVKAVEFFTAGDEPSLVFGGKLGARRLVIPSWADWNSSDHSTVRVQKHRDSLTRNAFHSEVKRSCNANETLLEESRVEKSRVESAPVVAPAKEPMVKREPKRDTACPSSNADDNEVRAWLEKWSLVDAADGSDFEFFLDHHRAKGSTFKDWAAAWRTWIKRGAKFRRSQPEPSTTSPLRFFPGDDS